MSSCHPYNSSSLLSEKYTRLSFVSKSKQYGLRSVRSMFAISERLIRLWDCGDVYEDMY